MRGIGLRAGHADLTTRVDVDAAMSFAADGAPHCVGHAHAQRSALLGVTQGLQRVRGLAALGYEDAGVVPEEGGPPVQHVTGYLENHWNVGQLLYNLAGGEAGVVRGPACREDEPAPVLHVVHM